MKGAVKLVGLAALLLSATACDRAANPADKAVADNTAVVFTLNPSNEAADSGCGGRFSPARLRYCAKLGETRRFAGLFMRTFEGADFFDGSRPDVPFADRGDGYAELAIDDASTGTALLPPFRGPPVPVDTIFISFEGRKVLDRSSDPARFGASPIILVDRVIAARRVAATHVRRRLPDGSINSGF